MARIIATLCRATRDDGAFCVNRDPSGDCGGPHTWHVPIPNPPNPLENAPEYQSFDYTGPRPFEVQDAGGYDAWRSKSR